MIEYLIVVHEIQKARSMMGLTKKEVLIDRGSFEDHRGASAGESGASNH